MRLHGRHRRKRYQTTNERDAGKITPKIINKRGQRWDGHRLREPLHDESWCRAGHMVPIHCESPGPNSINEAQRLPPIARQCPLGFMAECDPPLRAAIDPPYHEDSGRHGQYYDGNDNERNNDFVEVHGENVHGSSLHAQDARIASGAHDVEGGLIGGGVTAGQLGERVLQARGEALSSHHRISWSGRMSSRLCSKARWGSGSQMQNSRLALTGLC
jgi:hypothetical protein